MAFYDTTFYCNSVGYAAVTVRPQNAAVAAGVLRKQFTAPAVGSERVFVCIVAGTTANVTDATWVLTRGARTTDGTATWQECTGASAVNGDLTNTATWTQAKAIGTPTLGAIIQRNNGASYWICSTAGTMGASEPAWANNTAGTTQVDGTTTWTCLGAVGSFTGGGAPFARLQAACTTTWFAAGNTIYVGSNHAESQTTAITFAPTGSAATVGRILCHNPAGSYPPAAGNLTTGATISTTGAVNMLFSPAASGAFYLYGLAFKAAVGQATTQNVTLTAGGSWFYLDRCSFELATTGSSATISISGAAAGVVVFNNTTVKFAAVGQTISVNGQFIWQNTGQILVAGSSVPTNLMTFVSSSFVSGVLEALDLSQCSGNLVAVASVGQVGQVLIKDCKLHASAAIPTPTVYGVTIQLVRCDSAATGYKSARYTYEATETTETSITRVDGSVDPTGQAQSRKLATTANVQWLRPFRAEPYAVWNDRTATNVVVTVYGTVNDAVLPRNDDIWLEVEYLGSSATPIGTIVATTLANLLTADAAVAADVSSWNGGGSGAGWSPFKLTTTLSSPQPGLAGYLHARIRAAKPSTTYYIDPQVVLS